MNNNLQGKKVTNKYNIYQKPAYDKLYLQQIKVLIRLLENRSDAQAEDCFETCIKAFIPFSQNDSTLYVYSAAINISKC